MYAEFAAELEAATQYPQFFSSAVVREYIKHIRPYLLEKEVNIKIKPFAQYLVKTKGTIQNSQEKVAEEELVYHNVSSNQYKRETHYTEKIYKLCRFIGEKYTKNALMKSLDKLKYTDDIIILTDTREREAMDPAMDPAMDQDKAIDDFTDEPEILGILIVSRGGCVARPDAYELKLICTTPDRSGLSKILIGLYLYTIIHHWKMKKKMIIAPIGLLEIAGSYQKNLAAFCSYAKFGFKFDPSLDFGRCFNNANLPMSINLARVSKRDIIQKVMNETADMDPLCNRELKTTFSARYRWALEFYKCRDFLRMLLEIKKILNRLDHELGKANVDPSVIENEKIKYFLVVHKTYGRRITVELNDMDILTNMIKAAFEPARVYEIIGLMYQTKPESYAGTLGQISRNPTYGTYGLVDNLTAEELEHILDTCDETIRSNLTIPSPVPSSVPSSEHSSVPPSPLAKLSPKKEQRKTHSQKTPSPKNQTQKVKYAKTTEDLPI